MLKTDTTHDGGCGGTLVLQDHATVCAACGERFWPCTSSDCDQMVSENDDSQYAERSDDKAGTYCWGCYEADTQYCSTLTRFAADTDRDERSVHFGDIFAVGPYGETPEWFDEFFPNGVHRVWKSTDAWRGYHNTIEAIEGVTDITHGWATGDYSDVPWKRDTHRLLEMLDTAEPPVPIYVLAEPTSNVFSTAVDVFTRDADHEAAVAWLAEQDFTVEALDRAFG